MKSPLHESPKRTIAAILQLRNQLRISQIPATKTKSKAKRFLKLDRLGMRIAHAQKYFTRRRKERAERAFERSMLQAT